MSKRTGKIYEYLEKSGVLENGSEEEIKKVKQAYRKKYLTDYKREHRKRRPEFVVGFSEQNGDLGRVLFAAQRLKMAPTAYIRAAALSYLKREYILPNPGQITLLEGLLSECVNQVQAIAGKKEKYFWDRSDKISAIEKRIAKLEKDIDGIFRHPPLAKDSPIQP